MNKYYVYVYLDPRKHGKYCYKNICFLYEPFYIGKGSGNRIFHKHDNHCKNILNKIIKSRLEPIRLILISNLYEENAFEIEKQYIEEIGRLDLQKGNLVNNTNGGEGTSGFKLSEIQLKNIRKDFTIISNKFKEMNYKLLTKENEYKNKNTKLKFICNKGHLSKITWSSIQYNHGCKFCADNIRKNITKKNFDIIKNKFKEMNYKLLTKEYEYENKNTKLKFICNKGHISQITWSSVQKITVVDFVLIII